MAKLYSDPFWLVTVDSRTVPFRHEATAIRTVQDAVNAGSLVHVVLGCGRIHYPGNDPENGAAAPCVLPKGHEGSQHEQEQEPEFECEDPCCTGAEFDNDD